MTDFGTPEERALALRVCDACTALNNAIRSAQNIGVNVKVVDLAGTWDEPSKLQVERMERRVMILPERF